MDSYTHNSIPEHGHGHVLQMEKVLHMTSGVGENSYSHNSTLQLILSLLLNFPLSFYGINYLERVSYIAIHNKASHDDHYLWCTYHLEEC